MLSNCTRAKVCMPTVTHIFFALFLLTVAGCKSTAYNVVKEESGFLVVQTNKKMSYEALAQKTMGSELYASLLSQYNNGGTSLDANELVFVPKDNFYPSAVFSTSYQTVPILCYHQFTNKKSTNSKMMVTAKEFEEQMQYLYQHGYNVASLDTFEQFMNGKAALPKKTVVLTVDDGYRSFLEFGYPILKKYGFHSTLFVYPQFVGGGKSLTWEEIQQLDNSDLVSVESHSLSHSNLSQLLKGESFKAYEKRMRTEVGDTHSMLQAKLSKQPRYFAYPYGASSKELTGILKEYDYKLGLTVDRGGNSTFSSQYMMNRTMIYGGDSLDRFISALETSKNIE